MDCFASDTVSTESCPSDGHEYSSVWSCASSQAEWQSSLAAPWVIDGDYGLEDDDFPSRGWSMRRGHVKRLVTPKTGKAAARAELHGQGKDVSRGRSVFKRSVNSSGRWKYVDFRMTSTAKMRVHLRDHIADEIDAMSEMENDWYLEDFNWHLWSEAEEAIDKGVVCDVNEDVPLKSESVLSLDHDNLCVKQKSYVKKPTSLQGGVFQALAGRLANAGGVIAQEDFPTNKTTFEALQWKFLEDYGVSCCNNLQKCYPGYISLRPTTLCAEVQQQFLRKRAELQDCLKPAYHGTQESNLRSICTKGLLIPGQGNDLRIANGSAYGIGIYTAKLNNPHLSYGYCRGGRKMLLCGVLDDAEPGAMYNAAQDVRHGGDATIFFDESRVVPLFQASLDGGVLVRNTNAKTVVFDWARHARILLRVLDDNEHKSSRRQRVSSRPVTQVLSSKSQLQGSAAFLARRAVRKRLH